MSILTFDLETSTAALAKRKASPFHPDNYIVAAGFKVDGEPCFGHYYASQEVSDAEYTIPFTDDTSLLVGFNIKFDLLYSWARSELKEFFKRGGQIWDCQYVEYLLEGQQQHWQMCSMDMLVEKYGGSLKLDEVKELWNAGVDTPDIDPDLLMTYLLGDGEDLQGDVNNTYLIFEGQMERCRERGPKFLAMVMRRMDGLLATTEMEYNGIQLDTDLLETHRVDMLTKLEELDEKLERFIPELPPELEFNWQSPVHKSALIYGGAIKYEKWTQHTDPDTREPLYAKKTESWPVFSGVAVSPATLQAAPDSDKYDGGLYQRPDGTPQDRYKSGKRKGEGKFKNTQVPDLDKPKGAIKPYTVDLPGYTPPKPEWQSSLTDGKGVPIWSTAGENLETLVAERGSSVEFLQVLGARGKLKKDLGTYYYYEDPKTGERKGMLTLVGDDGLVHHQLNHVNTKTTRMSSSNPNGQNLAGKEKSDVKRGIVSRFGDEGQVVELDYSQLEVVVQGVLTEDPQLIADLNAGVDFHCKRLAFKENKLYEEVVKWAKEEDDPNYPTWSKKRKGVKGFSFQRAYGAGAAAIALSTGMSVDDVNELIEAEEKMFPGLTKFDEAVEASIGATAEVTKMGAQVRGQWFNFQRGYWDCPITATRFMWTEGVTPDFLWKHGKFVGFSPTERKNWPIQGMGGFVMQCMLGYVMRYLIKHDFFGGNVVLFNTVHDSVWLDVHKDYLWVVEDIKKILAAVPAAFKRNFNYDCPVQFPVDAEVGDNMIDLHGYRAEDYTRPTS